jgi:aminoglycoside 3-N-acetyltransferase I
MSYTIKKLNSTDLLLFKELLKVFGHAFGEVDTYQKAVPSDMYLASLLSKEHFIVLVALHADTVVGGLVAYELEKFEQERTEIYIYDLAVAEHFRRQGIATKLISELKIIAKERGAYVIFVQADPGDAPAIQLYESLGARENVHHFDIPV